MDVEVYGAAIPIIFFALLFCTAALSILGAFLVGIVLTTREISAVPFYLGLILAAAGFAATVFIAAVGAVKFYS